MKIMSLVQGTPEWHQHRSNSRNASDAPAMMGASAYKSRTQLIKERATGITPEVDPATQARFDRGHEIEEKSRPLAEAIIGDDLYPVIGQTDDGYLSASFDGLTMDGSVLWECKSWNESKAADVRGGLIPETDFWQLVQQLVVSEAEKALYMVTDGEREVHAWFSLDPADGARLLEGWKQFDADMATYTPEPAPVEAIGRAPETLPALRIELTGMVSASNLTEFRETALSVFRNINTELQTDNDFADAEKTVKWCKGVEDRLAAAKEHALSQTADIDALFKAIDDISAEARTVRLNLDKQVKGQKEQRRADIHKEAFDALAAHVEQINVTLGGKIRLPEIHADFSGAMKGKKTIASLRDAADTELARAKIEANQVADRIRLNLETLRADAAGYETLFADAQQLVLKENDDLKNIIKLRISEHRDAEQARLDAERERIRAEEKAKAEAEARRRAEESAASQQSQASPQAALEYQIDQITHAPETGSDNQATMKLGDINNLIAPISISADGLAQLGFQHVGQERAAKLYRASDVQAICQAIANHVIKAARRQAAA